MQVVTRAADTSEGANGIFTHVSCITVMQAKFTLIDIFATKSIST